MASRSRRASRVGQAEYIRLLEVLGHKVTPWCRSQRSKRMFDAHLYGQSQWWEWRSGPSLGTGRTSHSRAANMIVIVVRHVDCVLKCEGKKEENNGKYAANRDMQETMSIVLFSLVPKNNKIYNCFDRSQCLNNELQWTFISFNLEISKSYPSVSISLTDIQNYKPNFLFKRKNWSSNLRLGMTYFGVKRLFE